MARRNTLLRRRQMTDEEIRDRIRKETIAFLDAAYDDMLEKLEKAADLVIKVGVEDCHEFDARELIIENPDAVLPLMGLCAAAMLMKEASSALGDALSSERKTLYRHFIQG